ncbi:MAG TPA: 30S ribosomal protein S6 [Bryobacteraceae bacterium]|nr:30S ribosomal protein S6 [Bryobacteraceae bacterium]
MRIYEELFIVRPNATDEEIDPLVEQVSQVITSRGGAVDKSDKWGVRKLAYRLQKQSEGYYILLQFSATPETVKEVERRLRVSDLVMKFITVRIDEKLKKIEKRKKSREKRASRKPAPAAAAPAMPTFAAEPAAVPGSPAPGMPAAPAPAAPAASTEEK